MKYRRALHISLLALSIVIIISAPDNVGAEICELYSDHVRRVGWLQTGECFADVEVRDGYAYMAEQSCGLRIADVSDPTNPRLVASLEIDYVARDIHLAGDLAFLPMYRYTVVADVADPYQPVALGVIRTEGSPESILVDGHLAYVTTASRRVEIHDISDPTAPVRLSQVLDLSIVDDLVLWNNLLFVAGWRVVHVIDVSDPASPTVVSDIPTREVIRSLGHHEDHIYLGTQGPPAWIFVVDPGAPGGPEIVNELKFSEVSEFRSDGTVLYAVSSSRGLSMFDMANPTEPRLIGSINVGKYPHDLAVAEGLVYTTCCEDGLQIVDPSSRSFLTPLASSVDPAVHFVLHVDGEFAFAGCRWPKGESHDNGLRVYHAAGPNHLERIAQVVAPGEGMEISDMAKAGHEVYLAVKSDGVFVFDVADPVRPRLQGVLDGDEAAVGVAAAGDMLLTVSEAGFLRSYKILDQERPCLVGEIQVGSEARDVALDGTTAYVCLGDAGVAAVEMSKPESPVIVWRADTPGHARHVVVFDDLLAVADGQRGLTIIKPGDASDGAPVILSNLDTPWTARRVHARNGLVYVADDRSGVQVIDATDPSAPMSLGFMDGDAFDVDGGSEGILIGGPIEPTLSLAPFHCAGTTDAGIVTQTPSARLAPNPFNACQVISFSLQQAGPVRVSIYDIRGRLVRELADGDRPAGQQTVTWRGTDETGRSMPSGSYFVRLEYDRRSEILRAAFIK